MRRRSPYALGLCLMFAGCGGPPAAPLPTLEAWLARATLDAVTPDAVTADAVTPNAVTTAPPRVQVLRLEPGRAWVRVALRGADARRERRGQADVVRLALPFEADFPSRVGALPASIELPDGARFTIGPTKQLAGIDNIRAWIEGAELLRRVASDGGLPPAFELTYPAPAAAVAAAGLLPDEPPDEILLTTVDDGLERRRALRLDPGTTLGLSALEGGRLTFELAGAGRLQHGPGPDVRTATPDRRVALDLEHPLALRALEAPVFLLEPFLERGGETVSDAPDVLVLLLDTLRADRVGPWRDGPSLTPTLDALLAESTVWERAWSTAPWTLPSIATLMTGRQAADHGAYHRTAPLSPDPTTLAEAFAASGYRTAAFTDAGYFQPSFGLDRGFHHFDARAKGVRASAPALLDWLADGSDTPRFAVLHTYAVHEPYEPRDPSALAVLERFSEDEAALIVRPSDGIARLESEQVLTIPPALTDAMSELYDLEVRELDRDLASLLERLASDGRLERTVVAVVADHGEEFGERGLAGHGDTLFPEQLHVPLAIRIPGRPAARVATPVSTVDFAATLLDAAGLDAAAAGLPGSSLLDDEEPSPTWAWRQPHGERGALRAVRAGGRLLVEGEYRFPRTLPANGLFDLDVDPDAATDLLPSASPADLAELRALLARHPEPPPIQAGALDPALAAQLEALGYR